MTPHGSDWARFVRWYAAGYCARSDAERLSLVEDWICSRDLAIVAIVAATGTFRVLVEGAIDEWIEAGCPEVDG